MAEVINKPDFFIVGAPKCGTTAMDAFLGEHPDIYMSPVKELHYFGADIEFSTPKLSLDDYLVQFKGVTSEKRVGESSVWYLYSKSAAVEIQSFSPLANIIVMIRNPIAMMYSLHSQLVYEGEETIRTFKEALYAEGERKAKQLVTPRLYYRDIACYSTQIKRYFDTFGRKNVLIIVYDDFKNNLADTYRKTLQFLRVENLDFQPNFRIVNPNKEVRFLRLQSFIKDPQNGIRKVIKRFIPRHIRGVLLKSAHDFNVFYSRRPQLDVGLRNHLQDEFSDEVKKLSLLINRDLSHWVRSV